MRPEVIALCGRFFQRSVHEMNLFVGPGTLGIGEAVIHVLLGACVLERVGSEELLACDQFHDLCCRSDFATGVAEAPALFHPRGRQAGDEFGEA